MNNQKWTKGTIIKGATIAALKLTMLVAMACSAKAEIQPGFYKGHFKNDRGHNHGVARIFIENVQVDGMPVSYGLILNDKQDTASAFKIEELSDGTQAWIRITEKASGLIGSNSDQDAIYNVSMVKDGLTHKLNFTPTNLANSLGCKMEIISKKRESQDWQQLPTEAESYKAYRGKQKVFVSKTTINGRYYVGTQLKSGTSNVSEVIPNIGVIRSQSLNSESEDGRSMDRQITALITIIHRKYNIFGGYRLKMVNLSANGCFDGTNTLH